MEKIKGVPSRNRIAILLFLLLSGVLLYAESQGGEGAPGGEGASSGDSVGKDASSGEGWIGLGIGFVPPSMRGSASVDATEGAFIYYVVLGSPAEHAGLLPGDVIFRVGDQEVRGPDQVTRIFHGLSPHDRVELEVTRFGTLMSFGLSLIPLPDPEGGENRGSRVWPGFSVAKLTEDIVSRLQMAHTPGSFVIGRVEMGSPAYIGGLRTGDIISSVEGREVDNFADFYNSINVGSPEISIQIYRRGQSGTVHLHRKVARPEN